LYQISEFKLGVEFFDYFLQLQGFKYTLPAIVINNRTPSEAEKFENDMKEGHNSNEVGLGYPFSSELPASNAYPPSGRTESKLTSSQDKSRGGESGDEFLFDDQLPSPHPEYRRKIAGRRRIESKEANVGNEEEGSPEIKIIRDDSLGSRGEGHMTPPNAIKKTRSFTAEEVRMSTDMTRDEPAEEIEVKKKARKSSSNEDSQGKRKNIFYRIMEEIFPFEEKLKFYFVEMAFLLEYMESKNLVLRNFDPKSVLLTESGHICWDVGVWNNQSYISNLQFQNTNELFLPPEVIFPDRYYDPNSTSTYDPKFIWWIMSVFFFYSFYGKYPHQILKNQFVSNYSKWPTNMSSPCNDFFQKMFSPARKDRYCSIAHLQSHPFFASIDWTTLSAQIKNGSMLNNMGPVIPSSLDIHEYYESFQTGQDYISNAMSLNCSYAEISQNDQNFLELSQLNGMQIGELT
jgi:hypothetical protein